MYNLNLDNISSSKIVEIIRQGNIDVVEFDRLNLWIFISRNDWKKLLVEFPQYSEKYIEGFTFGVVWWNKLLLQQSALLESAKKYKVGWAAIIMNYPHLESECPYWDSFSSHDWSMIISAQPQFLEKCPLVSSFNGKNWSVIFAKQPYLSNRYDKIHWFGFDEWIYVLSESSYFFEEAKKYTLGWVAILVKNPELADECKVWDSFEKYDWIYLLGNRPEFIDRCEILDKFEFYEWLELLKQQPRLIEYCKCSSSFRKTDWAKFLMVDPTLIDSYNIDMDFDTCDWCDILISQPQFADIFYGWQNFSFLEWGKLLRMQSQFVRYAKNYHQGRCYILKMSPNLLPDFYEWDKISSKNWNSILKYQPTLISHCTIPRSIDFEIWYNILSKHLQFIDMCPDEIFDKLTPKQWEELEAQYPGVFEGKRMLSTLRKL